MNTILLFKKWKVSGFHGDIPVDLDLHELTEAADKPFSDFTKCTSILYMHQYVYMHPNILENVTGECY